MNALAFVRLARAEWRGRRVVAMVALLVVVAISSAGIVAGLQTRDRAAEHWDHAFTQAHGAHVTVSSGALGALRAVVHDPRVAEATHPYRLVGNVQLAGKPALVREVRTDDLPRIARPLLRDGRWVRAGSSDEIVIERSFALDQGLGVGDGVRVEHAGRAARFVVVGVAIDLIDCFFPQCDPTTAWADPEGFARIAGSHWDDVSSAVFVRLRDPATAPTFGADALSRHAKLGINTWRDTRTDALAVVGFLGAFLAGLGLFLTLAAAVVIASTMAGRVVARRRDIGLLKSVGVSPRQVTASIVLAHAAVAAVGITLGWFLGGVLAGPSQLTIGRVLDGAHTSLRLRDLVVAFVVVETIVFLATIVPAWRAGRLPTTAALSSASSAPRRLRRGGHVWGGRLGPVVTRGVRDAFARPARVAFTVLALVLAIVGIVVTAGVGRSVDRAIAHPALTGNPSDLAVVPIETGGREVPAALDRTPNVAAWWGVTEAHAVIGNESVLVRALSGDVADAGYVVREGRMSVRPGQAIAGYGLLERLGAHVGDRVSVTIDGTPVAVTIVGRYSESEDNGVVLQLPAASLPAKERRVGPDHYLVRLRSANDAAATTAALQRMLGSGVRVVARDASTSDDISAFHAAFLIVAILVAAVAFANLLGTLLLSVRERAPITGVLRTIGFRPIDTLLSTALTAGLQAAVAISFGIPLGVMASRAIVDNVTSGAGIGPGLAIPPTGAALAATALAVVLCAVGSAVIVARRSASVEIATLVRGE